jgi:hypothetical protein
MSTSSQWFSLFPGTGGDVPQLTVLNALSISENQREKRYILWDDGLSREANEINIWEVTQIILV